jgi:hypothetical protein
VSLFPRLFNRSSAPSPGEGGFWNRTVQALSTVLHLKMVNAYRDQFNPLRGLTIRRAIQYLEDGERGAYADVQWLYRKIEKRDPTLKGLIERYEGGLLKLEWEICTVDEDDLPKGCTPEMAEKQAEALRAAYDRIDNLQQALQFLILADFRGYSHLEKHRDDGGVFHLEPVDQWYWVRDGINGAWQYNQKAAPGTTRGLEIDPERLLRDFIIREVSRPVNEIALLNYVFKNLCKKDWAAFVESFGVPWLFLVGPPNVPKDKEADYQSTAQQIIGNSRGYLPNGSDVKSGSEGSRGVNPHKQFKDDLSEEVVLAGTGGKLTMLAESGSGTLAGAAHQDAWEELLAGKARLLTEIFQCQFDKKEILEKQFPGQPVLAYFKLSPEGQDEEDQKFKREVWKAFLQDGTVNDILANLISLKELTKGLGLPVNKDYIDPWVPVLDQNGKPVSGEVVTDPEGDIIGADPGTEEPGQETTPQPAKESDDVGSLRNRATGVGFEKAARVAVATALARDLQPLRTRLERILQIEDPEVLSNRLQAFQEDVSKLGQDILADPELAKVLADIQGAGVLQGFAKAKEQQK